AGMWLRSRHVYPVPYQWRRVLTLAAAAVALTVVGRAIGSLPVAIALTVVYPVVLLPLGFYLPAELRPLPRLAPGLRRTLHRLRLAGVDTRDPLREERVDDSLLAVVELDLGAGRQPLDRGLRRRFLERQPREHARPVRRAVAGDHGPERLLL